ncbi:MAG: APC family permease [Pseudomonadota bacterium]
MVGLGGAILNSLNGVVGSGIFALPALLFAAAGSFSPIAILIFAGLYGCVVAVVAKLSTRFRQSGGGQLYAEHAFGPAVGFQVGWFSLCVNMGGAAAGYHVMVSYLAAIFPVFDGTGARLMTIGAMILAFTAITASGAARSIGAIALGTVLKLSPFIILIAVGFAQNGVPTEVTLPTFGNFESIALLLAFAFSGCDVAVYAAGESKEPRKTMARALAMNLTGVAVFYVLVQLAYNATAPDPSQVDIPLAAMGEKLLGPTGSLLVSLAAVFSIATFQLNISFLVPRVIFGMARRGLMPHAFAYVSPRFKTPVVAIGFFGAFVAALSLSGGFELLAILAVSVEQLGFLTVIAALVAMWYRDDAGLRADMDARWAVIIPIAVLYIAWLMSQLEAQSVLYMGIMVGAGFALYFVSRDSAVKQDGIDLPEGRI